MMISVYDRVENIMGKGENDGYQCFPQCYQKTSFAVSLKKAAFSPFPTRFSTISKTKLTLSQTKNSRLFQTESVSRQQFQIL